MSRAGIEAGRAYVLLEAVDKTGVVFQKVVDNFKRARQEIEFSRRIGLPPDFKYYTSVFSKFAASSLADLRGLKIGWSALGQLVGSVLTSIGNRIKQVGGMMTGMGFRGLLGVLSIAYPLRNAVDVGATFEDKMASIQGVLKLTNQQLEKVEATIRESAKSAGFLATEVGEVFLELARGGLSMQETIAALPNVLNMIRGTDVDPTIASKLFVQAIKTMDVPLSEMTKVADAFTTASNESLAGVEDLAVAFSYASGYAKTLNYDLYDLVGFLAQLSSRGLIGSKAGTSLSNFMANLASEAQKIEDITGVLAFDETGTPKDPLQLLRELSAAFKDLNQQQRAVVAQRIFNERGVRAAMTVVDGIAQLEFTMRAIRTREGVAAEMAKLRDDRSLGTIRRLKAALDDLRIAINKALRPAYEFVDKTIIPLINRLTAWVSANKSVVNSIVAIAAALGVVSVAMIAFGAVLSMIGSAITGLGALASALGSVLSVATALAAFFGVPVIAVLGVGAAIAAAAVAQLALALLQFYLLWKVAGKMGARDNFFKKIGQSISTLISIMSRLWRVFQDNLASLLAMTPNMPVIWKALFSVDLLAIIEKAISLLEFLSLTIRAVANEIGYHIQGMVDHIEYQLKRLTDLIPFKFKLPDFGKILDRFREFVLKREKVLDKMKEERRKMLFGDESPKEPEQAPAAPEESPRPSLSETFKKIMAPKIMDSHTYLHGAAETQRVINRLMFQSQVKEDVRLLREANEKLGRIEKNTRPQQQVAFGF